MFITIYLHLSSDPIFSSPSIWVPMIHVQNCFITSVNYKPRDTFSQECLAQYQALNSVQFSRSVTSSSLWPHELQHARPPCPSPTPGVHPNSCASSPWCHPAISSSVIPFSSCPQSLPASVSFPVNQLFQWGGQSIGVSALASVLPMNNEHPGLVSFRLDWLDLLAVQGTRKASILRPSAFFTVQLSHPYTTTEKTIALTRRDLCWQSNISAF